LVFDQLFVKVTRPGDREMTFLVF